MRSPTLDANVQFMQEASQMKNSKHVKLKTFFDPCQTHLLYMISLNLSPLSTLCTLQTITYKKSIFYLSRIIAQVHFPKLIMKTVEVSSKFIALVNIKALPINCTVAQGGWT